MGGGGVHVGGLSKEGAGLEVVFGVLSPNYLH